MKPLTLALAAIVATIMAPGIAFADAPTPATIEACIYAAASVYHEPPAVLVILLNVEGGTLGAVSHNTNGTVDIGPMQVNQLWIPQLDAHWQADPQTTYEALRDNFCANVEAGAWILRQGLDKAHGDFWGGVGYYHSYDPIYQNTYLRSVLAQVLRLEKMANAQSSPAAGQVAGITRTGGG
jgi:hypothetical protein